jgi:hypothetical protein
MILNCMVGSTDNRTQTYRSAIVCCQLNNSTHINLWLEAITTYEAGHLVHAISMCMKFNFQVLYYAESTV